MKYTRMVLISWICFASAAWAQGNSPNNWSEFLRTNMARYNPYETVLGVDNVPYLQLKWSFEAGTDDLSSPSVAGGRVFYQQNTAYGYVYAVDANTGDLLWDVPGGASPTQIAVENNTIYYGDGYCCIVALDAATGAGVWSFDSTSGWAASPTVLNGVVYIGGNNGGLWAVANGGQVWYDGLPGAASAPAVVNGVAYFLDDSNSLDALDASNGSHLWTQYLGGYVLGSPVVANGTVYAGTANMYAFNATTGAILWSYSTGNEVGTPAVANGVVYVPSGNDLYALNATTGALEWNTDIGGGVSAPAVANGVVYVGAQISYTGNRAGDALFALNASTGAVLWSYRPEMKQPTYANVSPSVANGMVYFVCANTQICAFGLK